MNYSTEYVEKKLRELVLESITLQFGYQDKQAEDLVDHSSFPQILKEDPDFVGHYPPDYWADYIVEEVKLINGEN